MHVISGVHALTKEKPTEHAADPAETGPPKAPRPGPLADLLLATAFLTRLPVPAGQDAAPGALSRAGWAFPVIGAVIGAIGGGLILLTTGSGLHPLVSALLALAAMAILTGALHEDGLADFADGLGVRGREKRLAAMADSRIGAFGVLALVFSVGLRAGALMSLAGPGIAVATLVGAAALSRAVMVAGLFALPPARDGGLGQSAGRPPVWIVGLALGIGLAVLLAVLWPVNGAGVIAVIGAGVAAALFMTWLLHAALGGQTGDGLGAQQQITETVIYMAVAATPLVL